MRQKGFVPLVLLVIVAVGMGGAIYYFTQTQSKVSEAGNNPTLKVSPTASPVNRGQQKRFQNSQYLFSLEYPAGWSYRENDPYVPNLAEYTVTFSSTDQDTVLDVWVKSGDWVGIEQDLLKDKGTIRSTVAGQPAVIQSQDGVGRITFVKHPLLIGKVLVFTNIGDNLETADQIQQTLNFE